VPTSARLWAATLLRTVFEQPDTTRGGSDDRAGRTTRRSG
jgi:hypothetical protein